MLRVAICITTHNRRVELERTLAHLATLSPPPDELLVVADGCTDGTAAWVREKHPTARLFEHTPGRGSIPSRNVMGRATGCDVFLSLDDDSYPIEPDAIARIRTLFEKNARLAVAEFPQRTDERPGSLTQADFGAAQFIGSYANSGAAVRRVAFAELGGYVDEFVHAYEEPDFAVRCCAAGWQVRFEPVLHVRHHYTTAQRDECRTHQRHARNEWWSVLLRCPMPAAIFVGKFRSLRQLGYAWKRGWALREPAWWWQAMRGIPAMWKMRAPLPWAKYKAWMHLVRTPHDDLARWEREFAAQAGSGSPHHTP